MDNKDMEKIGAMCGCLIVATGVSFILAIVFFTLWVTK